MLQYEKCSLIIQQRGTARHYFSLLSRIIRTCRFTLCHYLNERLSQYDPRIIVSPEKLLNDGRRLLIQPLPCKNDGEQHKYLYKFFSIYLCVIVFLMVQEYRMSRAFILLQNIANILIGHLSSQGTNSAYEMKE